MLATAGALAVNISLIEITKTAAAPIPATTENYQQQKTAVKVSVFGATYCK